MVKAKKKEAQRFKYTVQQLKSAVAEIKLGKSVRAISKKYSIPRSTLNSKIKETSPKIRKGGPETVLTKDEEQHLISWMMLMSENGFPVSKTQLLGSVKMILSTSANKNREHPFKDRVPGRSWLTAFLIRHPQLSERIAQNLTISRAAITESSIRSWFSEINVELVLKSLLEIEDSRVFNGDESAFMLAPKSQKVFVKKGEKSVYNIIQNDDKECLTTLFVASASGQLAPPLVIFSYKRIPNSIRENMPEGWAAGKSDNGWMNGENFYEYVANIFYPWLVENKVKFPVILYIDGHSSHLTMAVSDFCREKQIVLIALHPNATHILQPLDVAFFHPLKVAWQKVVTDWRINNNGNKITKENFATLLKSAVDTLDIKSIMKNGFKTTGLHPFSADAVNYSKLRNKTKRNEEQDNAAPENEDHYALRAMEKYIDPITLRRFEEVDVDGEWDGDLKDSNLFMVWKSMKNSLPTLKNNLNESFASTSAQDPDTTVDVSLCNINDDIEFEFLDGLPAQQVSENDMQIAINNDLIIIEAENICDEPDNEIRIQIDDNLTEELTVLENTHNQSYLSIDKDLRIEENNETISGNIETTLIEEQQLRVQNKENFTDNFANKGSNINENFPPSFREALVWPGKATDKKKKRKPKDKVPSVISSLQWKHLNEVKEEEKLKKIADVEKRKIKRAEAATAKKLAADERRKKRLLAAEERRRKIADEKQQKKLKKKKTLKN